MRKPAFCLNEALRLGWDLAWVHWRFYLKALLAASLPLLLISAIQFPITIELFFRPSMPLNVANILLSLVSGVLGLILEMGMMYVSLKLLRGEQLLVRDVFACWRYTLPCLGASLLYFILYVSCFLLFMVPVIIYWRYILPGLGPSPLYSIPGFISILLPIVPITVLTLGLSFYAILIFDEELGPLASLKRSWEMTRGSKWSLYALFIALGAINLLGAIPLFLGWVITVPMALIALAHAYEKMKRAGEQNPAAEGPDGPPELPPPIAPYPGPPPSPARS